MIKTETNPEIYSLHAEADLTQDFRNYNLYNLALKYINGIKKDVRLLDVGAGAGEFLSLLPKSVKGFGVEPSPKLRKLAQSKFSVEISFDNIDSIRDTYDVITMFDVLEHIENDWTFLKRVVQLLNDNGLLIIAVPSLQFLYGKRDYVTGHYRRYDYHQLKFMLRDLGLHNIAYRYWNMIGVHIYYISERIFNKEVFNPRNKDDSNQFKKLLNYALQCHFKYIENNMSFGIGLTLFSASHKKNKG